MNRAIESTIVDFGMNKGEGRWFMATHIGIPDVGVGIDEQMGSNVEQCACNAH